MSRDITSDAPHDVVRVQEQLLEMLRSAGKEAPPPRREPPVVAAATAVATVSPPKAPVAQPTAIKLTGAPPAEGEDCPQCGSDTPWGRSSWCPDCGYFPKAGFAGTGIVEEDVGPPPTLFSVIPAWVMPTLVGAIGILIGSIVTRLAFHDPLQRSLVAITQLLVFTALAFAAHSRASFIEMKKGKSWMAFVNPGETWASILARMPSTRSLILLLGCSFSGMGSSFLIGLDVDIVAEAIREEVKDNPKVTFSDIVAAMTKMTSKAFGDKKKNLAMSAFGSLMQATGQMSGDAGGAAGSDDLEGSIGSLAGTANVLTDNPGGGGGGGGGGGEGGLESSVGNLSGTASALTDSASSGSSGGSSGGSSRSSVVSKTIPKSTDTSTPKETTPPPEDVKPTESKAKGTFDYWIYGYTTNSDGELRSLLLATSGGAGKLRFSQKMGIEGFSTEQLSQITEQLKPFRASSAAVTSPYGGKWVKPVAKCRVEHEGLNADERPINPKYQKIILP